MCGAENPGLAHWEQRPSLKMFIRWDFGSARQCPWPVVIFWPHCCVVGLIGYWIYILPAGSPGSYSLSHTGDTYLGLRSLNGEGLNIAPPLQPQVCTEDSCRVDLNAVNLATQHPWNPSPSLAPFDLSSDPLLTIPSTPTTPAPTNAHTNWPFFAMYSEPWSTPSRGMFVLSFLNLCSHISLCSYMYT